MKVKISKVVCNILIGVLFVMSMTGCSGASGNTFSYEDSSKETPVSTMVNGRVESIDGNTITLLVGGGFGGRGGFGGGERPQMPEGEMPEGERPEMHERGELPEMPEGERAERPEGGEMPQGDMEQSTATLVISDESIIKLMAMGNRGQQAKEEMTTSEEMQPESEQGSLTDITEGSNLMINFDEDGNITEILVMSGRGMRDKKADA